MNHSSWRSVYLYRKERSLLLRMDDGYVYFYYYLLYGETGESIISEHGLWVLDFGMNMEKGCRIY